MSRPKTRTEYRVTVDHENGVVERASCNDLEEALSIAQMLSERAWNVGEPVVQSRIVHYDCWISVEEL